jgi:hypothetical protein
MSGKTLLLFGGTGATGSHVGCTSNCRHLPFLRASETCALQVPPHAVALGIKVVMFVRDPSKINQRYRWRGMLALFSTLLSEVSSRSFKDKVESFQGSMDDLDAVRKCVKQHVPDFILLTAALPRGQPFKPLSSAVIPAM